jgi:chromosome segregation ATPase
MAGEIPTILAAVGSAAAAVIGAMAGARYTLARAQKLRAEADSIIAASAGDLLAIMRKDLDEAKNRIATLEAAVAERSRAYADLSDHYASALHRIGELESEIKELRSEVEKYHNEQRDQERERRERDREQYGDGSLADGVGA